jgi:hypothetical protein
MMTQCVYNLLTIACVSFFVQVKIYFFPYLYKNMRVRACA